MADPILFRPTNPGWGAAATLAKRQSATPLRPTPVANQRQLETAGNTSAGYPASNFTYGQRPSAPQVNPAPRQALTAAQAYDYSADPVLQSVRAAGARSRADAQASALAARKRLAILFGDSTGIVDDTATAQAARGNPFSTLAEINRGYERDVKQTDEAYNKRNLFYGGHRGQALARALEGRQRGEYQARNTLMDTLGGVDRELAQALSAMTEREIQAENDAANRALQLALEYGVDPGQGTQQVTPQIGEALTVPSAPYLPPTEPAEIRRQLARGVNPIMFFK